MSALVDTDDTADEIPDAREAGDAAALARARRDPAHFAPIYERYDRAIFGYCYRRLGHPEQAADATMQTFARALAGINGFRAGSVRAWLFTIARHVVIDAARARRSHWPIEAAHWVRDATPLPDDLAIRSEQERALFAALAGLTPDQRHVIELRLAGLTGPEIATVLGTTHGAVKASQHRAFARLRTLLAAEDIFGDPS